MIGHQLRGDSRDKAPARKERVRGSIPHGDICSSLYGRKGGPRAKTRARGKGKGL